MYPFLLLLTGIVLCCVHGGAAAHIPYGVQEVIFLSATLLLGVPHGAADLLVARQNARRSSGRFSVLRFFVEYLGAILVFAGMFYFFPIIATFIFILLAAYHFGESDVSRYGVRGYAGVAFSGIYGLFIIGAIILPHWAGVMPTIGAIVTAPSQQHLLSAIGSHRYEVLGLLAVCMFIISIYSLRISASTSLHKRMFWVGTCGIVLIVAQLPMLLGFTCYFVFWHSIRSMHQIVAYLLSSRSVSLPRILWQMAFYSFMAIVGIAIVCIYIYGYTGSRSLQIYLFVGLAVLTAPHMRVMHHMYIAESGTGDVGH
jgi:Brp/Blh family beta-carotene 15,15'-monooxygenase